VQWLTLASRTGPNRGAPYGITQQQPDCHSIVGGRSGCTGLEQSSESLRMNGIPLVPARSPYPTTGVVRAERPSLVMSPKPLVSNSSRSNHPSQRRMLPPAEDEQGYPWFVRNDPSLQTLLNTVVQRLAGTEQPLTQVAAEAVFFGTEGRKPLMTEEQQGRFIFWLERNLPWHRRKTLDSPISAFESAGSSARSSESIQRAINILTSTSDETGAVDTHTRRWIRQIRDWTYRDVLRIAAHAMVSGSNGDVPLLDRVNPSKGTLQVGKETFDHFEVGHWLIEKVAKLMLLGYSESEILEEIGRTESIASAAHPQETKAWSQRVVSELDRFFSKRAKSRDDYLTPLYVRSDPEQKGPHHAITTKQLHRRLSAVRYLEQRVADDLGIDVSEQQTGLRALFRSHGLLPTLEKEMALQQHEKPLEHQLEHLLNPDGANRPHFRTEYQRLVLVAAQHGPYIALQVLDERIERIARLAASTRNLETSKRDPILDRLCRVDVKRVSDIVPQTVCGAETTVRECDSTEVQALIEDLATRQNNDELAAGDRYSTIHLPEPLLQCLASEEGHLEKVLLVDGDLEDGVDFLRRDESVKLSERATLIRVVGLYGSKPFGMVVDGTRLFAIYAGVGFERAVANGQTLASYRNEQGRSIPSKLFLHVHNGTQIEERVLTDFAAALKHEGSSELVLDGQRLDADAVRSMPTRLLITSHVPQTAQVGDDFRWGQPLGPHLLSFRVIYLKLNDVWRRFMAMPVSGAGAYGSVVMDVNRAFARLHGEYDTRMMNLFLGSAGGWAGSKDVLKARGRVGLGSFDPSAVLVATDTVSCYRKAFPVLDVSKTSPLGKDPEKWPEPMASLARRGVVLPYSDHWSVPGPAHHTFDYSQSIGVAGFDVEHYWLRLGAEQLQASTGKPYGWLAFHPWSDAMTRPTPDGAMTPNFGAAAPFYVSRSLAPPIIEALRGMSHVAEQVDS
jgi:hypothetical protein